MILNWTELVPLTTAIVIVPALYFHLDLSKLGTRIATASVSFHWEDQRTHSRLLRHSSIPPMHRTGTSRSGGSRGLGRPKFELNSGAIRCFGTLGMLLAGANFMSYVPQHVEGKEGWPLLGDGLTKHSPSSDDWPTIAT